MWFMCSGNLFAARGGIGYEAPVLCGLRGSTSGDKNPAGKAFQRAGQWVWCPGGKWCHWYGTEFEHSTCCFFFPWQVRWRFEEAGATSSGNVFYMRIWCHSNPPLDLHDGNPSPIHIDQRLNINAGQANSGQSGPKGQYISGGSDYHIFFSGPGILRQFLVTRLWAVHCCRPFSRIRAGTNHMIMTTELSIRNSYVASSCWMELRHMDFWRTDYVATGGAFC